MSEAGNPGTMQDTARPATAAPIARAANSCAVMDMLPGAGPRADSPLAYAKRDADTGPGSADGRVRLSENKLLGHLVLRGNGDNSAFVAGVERIIGVTLPGTLRSNAAGERSIRWISPDEWLIIVPGPQAFELERELRAELAGHYAIVNVSGGQTVLNLSGPAARSVLQKSTPYAVHDGNFPVGKVVTTVFAKSQAVIRRSGEEAWELVIRRSFADYIWQWLLDACGEYGLLIDD